MRRKKSSCICVVILFYYFVDLKCSNDGVLDELFPKQHILNPDLGSGGQSCDEHLGLLSFLLFSLSKPGYNRNGLKVRCITCALSHLVCLLVHVQLQ